MKKKKTKMSDKSGDGEEVAASSSPTVATAATADSEETNIEKETQAGEESSVEAAAKEAEPVAEDGADEATPPMDAEETESPAKSAQEAEQMEVDGSAKSPEPGPSSSEANDPLASRLAKVVKTSEPIADSDSSAVAPALSTENLISMLEGSSDRESSEVVKNGEQVASASTVSTSTSQPVAECKSAQSVSDLPPPKLNRKYIYKLKSKTGKVLKYVSSIPIVLKRPVISLTKMAAEEEEEDDETKTEAAGKAARGEAEDVDSDNSTKENKVKANDASKGLMGPRIARKRGRPPLLQKAPVITLDDSHSTDEASDGKESFKSVAGSSGSTPAYGVQTRKRQLKFLPDGRVVTPAGKKFKSAAAANAAAVAAAASSSKATRDENQSSDTDLLTESDDGSQSDRKAKKVPMATKKVTVDRKMAEKRAAAKKEFDYESYFREKSATSVDAAKVAKKVAETPKSVPPKTPVVPRNNSTPSTSKGATANSSTLAPASKNTVDPAQLLSSLIGISIFPHQLNVVKFKPKVIQDRKTMSAQKNVTFVDETPKKSIPSQPQQPRNTAFRVSSKPSLQKILPKPVSTPDRSSTVIRKSIDTPRPVPSAAARLAITSSKLNAALTSPVTYGSSSYRYSASGDASKFEHFTDTKVVKTKEGPKKQLKRKDEPADNQVKTVYDLVQNVFEQLPSWNLHVIPDTNSFCIAQVSRGRMGIPILKKSIELNGEFAAKVYVHQLHCKKYDGVYDTENKILSLIREIDALAA